MALTYHGPDNGGVIFWGHNLAPSTAPPPAGTAKRLLHRWQIFGDVQAYVWQNAGGVGVVSPFTHKRLYQNWTIYTDTFARVWQDTNSGVGAVVVVVPGGVGGPSKSQAKAKAKPRVIHLSQLETHERSRAQELVKATLRERKAEQDKADSAQAKAELANTEKTAQAEAKQLMEERLAEQIQQNNNMLLLLLLASAE